MFFTAAYASAAPLQTQKQAEKQAHLARLNQEEVARLQASTSGIMPELHVYTTSGKSHPSSEVQTIRTKAVHSSGEERK